MEIFYNPINEFELISDNGVFDKIRRLLNVSKDNTNYEDLALWILNSRFKNLTSMEVYNAFRMALDGSLLNEKKEMFNLFPVLNIKQTAEILRAYVIHKKEDSEVWKYKQKLIKLDNKKKDIDKEELFHNYISVIFDELKKNNFTDKATHYYKFIFNKKIFVSVELAKRLYRFNSFLFMKKFVNRKELRDSKIFKKEIISVENSLSKIKNKIINSGVEIDPVKVICRDIIVSKHLSKFKTIEDLKNEIKSYSLNL